MGRAQPIAASSSFATRRAPFASRATTRHVSSPASVPSTSGCSSRSSARAIAGAEPISDWTTTMFSADVALAAELAQQRLERVARVGALLAVRQDVAHAAERIVRLDEAELADVARDRRLRDAAARARERDQQLLLRGRAASARRGSRRAAGARPSGARRSACIKSASRIHRRAATFAPPPQRGHTASMFAEWIAIFRRTFKEFLADDCMGLAQGGRLQRAARVLPRDGVPARAARRAASLRPGAVVPRDGRTARRDHVHRRACSATRAAARRCSRSSSAAPARSGLRAARWAR